MKNIKFIIPIAILVMGVYITGCNDGGNKTDVSNKDANTETTPDSKTVAEGEVITVDVPSIQCTTCKKAITNALKEADGINGVDVSVKEKTVKVTYDKTKTDLSKIEATITSAGYDANDKKADKEAYEMLDDCCKRPEDQKDKDMHM